MGLKEIHTHIGNKWIKIIGISNELKKVLAGFDGDNLIAYAYIDHEAGITIEVVKLFDIQGEEIIYRESPPDKNTRIISRLDGIINSEELHVLPTGLINELELQIPEYISIYDRPDLAEFRSAEMFHEFRGDGYPDDVQILLLPNGTYKPELIWGRVEQYENEVLTCNLLNEPHQNLGIHLNDAVKVTLQTVDDNKYLVYQFDSTKTEESKPITTNKKPWYKFWKN